MWTVNSEYPGYKTGRCSIKMCFKYCMDGPQSSHCEFHQIGIILILFHVTDFFFYYHGEINAATKNS